MGGQGVCAEVLAVQSKASRRSTRTGEGKQCLSLGTGNQAESLLLSQIWDSRTSRAILPLLGGQEWKLSVEMMVVGRRCTEVFQDNFMSFSLCLCGVVSNRVAPPSSRAKRGPHLNRLFMGV
jgi:hypothetical protein